ncbi:MAG: beta strand repeat-containing protein, partial [Planctomycetaceae bacterium]
MSDSQVLRNLIGTDASGAVGLSNGQGVGIQVSGDQNLLSANVIARTFTGIHISGHDNSIEGNLIGTNKAGDGVLGNSSSGVEDSGTGTIVAGNVISGNNRDIAGFAISIRGSDTVVRGNRIGTDATGEKNLGNGSGIGCFVAGGERQALIADNVISGNQGPGITVGTTESVRIESNLIGTNKDGTKAIPNQVGIQIDSEPAGSIIGGESAEQGNVISGNSGDGVTVSPTMSGLKILNNYVGTNKAGDGKLGNEGAGVSAFGPNTTIGQPGAGNLISGNRGAGVQISLLGAETVVQANLIGTDFSGNANLGNDGAGIVASLSPDQTIGGATAGEGNLISGNGGWGVEFMAAGAPGVSVIERNRIGTNAAGTMRLPNAAGGIDMATGAPFEIVANLISGNVGDGVRAGGGLLAGSYRVIGNRIGTDASGGSDLGNARNGVHLRESGGPIVVGGTTPDERNVISGNGGNGVLSSSSPRNDIVGNYIGTDVHGANEIPNDLSGVRLDGSTAVRDNVVSSNGLDGIEVHSGRNEVRGNLVGVGADGASPLGNSRHGVSIDGGGAVPENAIGGPVGDGNTIAFNGGHGILIRQAHINLVKRNEIFSNGGDGVAVVEVPPFGATRNTISENAIFSNGGLGIDLADDEVTPNDEGDPDGGANLRQNFPVITRVTGGGSTIEGTLNSGSNSTYRIELFANTAAVACDPSGGGESERFLAETSVTTNGSGDASFSVPLTQPVDPENVITATATDSDGNTSEFSQCIQVPSRATLRVNKICQPANDDGRFDLRIDGSVAGTGDDAACGGTTGFVEVALGSHSIGETAGTGTSLGDYLTPAFGGDCDAQGNVSLAAGDNKTCTITNIRKGSAKVIK